MSELYLGNIREDLLKLGFAIDGFWDDVLGPKISPIFEKIESDITELMKDKGFEQVETAGDDSIKFNVYSKDPDAFILQIIRYGSGKIWDECRFKGYGNQEHVSHVFDALEEFYTETVKFTVERKDYVGLEKEVNKKEN